MKVKFYPRSISCAVKPACSLKFYAQECAFEAPAASDREVKVDKKLFAGLAPMEAPVEPEQEEEEQRGAYAEGFVPA